MRVLGVAPLLLGGAAYLGDSVVLVVLACINVAANVGLHALTNHRYRPEMNAAVELGGMLSLLAPCAHKPCSRPYSSVTSRRSRSR